MFKNLSTEALGFGVAQNEQIELALTHGFAGIDLDIVDFNLQVNMRGMEGARRLVDSAKIKLGTFELPTELHGDDEAYAAGMQKLPSLAQQASEIDCRRAVLVLPPYSDERPLHENFEFYAKRLDDIGRILGEHGVTLGVGFLAPAHLREDKPHEFVHTLDALTKLLETVSASNVGVLLDLWHLFASGGSADDVRKLSVEKIVAVQVADAPADTPIQELTEDARLLPGDPMVFDLGGAVAALVELGYEGPVTPTPHPAQFKGQRRDQLTRTVADALHRVWIGAGLAPAPERPPVVAEEKVETEAAEVTTDAADAKTPADATAAAETTEAVESAE